MHFSENPGFRPPGGKVFFITPGVFITSDKKHVHITCRELRFAPTCIVNVWIFFLPRVLQNLLKQRFLRRCHFFSCQALTVLCLGKQRFWNSFFCQRFQVIFFSCQGVPVGKQWSSTVFLGGGRWKSCTFPFCDI